MDWLEQELKSALARKDPSADFASRVMQRAEGRAERPDQRTEQSAVVYRWPRWLAAAAAMIVLAGAGMGYRQYRGEQAKEQVMRAFQIASVKVNRIQTQVREVGK